MCKYDNRQGDCSFYQKEGSSHALVTQKSATTPPRCEDVRILRRHGTKPGLMQEMH
ncbi:Protein of unknown function [Gryllus bimaculatus]|nr:Protein of unknown function [Gryllus bimaculatus]